MKSVGIFFESGASQTIVCKSGTKFVFETSIVDASFARKGNNLVISKDGITVTLQGFYTVYGYGSQQEQGNRGRVHRSTLP